MGVHFLIPVMWIIWMEIIKNKRQVLSLEQTIKVGIQRQTTTKNI